MAKCTDCKHCIERPGPDFKYMCDTTNSRLREKTVNADGMWLCFEQKEEKRNGSEN